MREHRMLAMMAHDLVGAISNVLGFGSLLEQQLKDAQPDVRRSLRRLTANARHMHAMLEGTLAVLRQPDQRPRPEPVDVSALLIGSVERHAVMVDSRRVGIQLDVPDTLVIETHPNSLARIVDNLVSNALKYAPQDSRVTVAARREGDWVRVTVEDEGTGLPVEPRPRDDGHGLGLAIVSRLAKLLGGEAGVSTGGGGTRFWVMIPGAHRPLAEAA